VTLFCFCNEGDNAKDGIGLADLTQRAVELFLGTEWDKRGGELVVMRSGRGLDLAGLFGSIATVVFYGKHNVDIGKITTITDPKIKLLLLPNGLQEVGFSHYHGITCMGRVENPYQALM